jgi:hypothetical protein
VNDGMTAPRGVKRPAEVCWLPNRLLGSAGRKDSLMVSEFIAGRWEQAYREYGLASELVVQSEPGDRLAARAMASASRGVAHAWRDIERVPGLPWWAVAAVHAAAEAFDSQARDWNARASIGQQQPQSQAGRRRVERAPLPVQPFPDGNGPQGPGGAGGVW